MPTSQYSKKPPQWLALHFPHLTLDQLERSQQQPIKTDIPRAISDTLSGRQCIIDHNQAANRVGIRNGMPLAAALTLADSLRVTTRDPLAEQVSLKRLAGWCYQYSSQVSIDFQRNSLLLEVAASQRLFGPAHSLAKIICSQLKKLGYHTDCGIAPIAETALLAARHSLHIHTTADIRDSISALSIESLHLQPSDIQTLQNMGFRTIADVLRVPDKALARRLGPALTDYLGRLLGYRPDPRQSFHPADKFSSGMDIPETAHTQGLVFPLRRLLQELCGVLRACDCGIQAIEICLQLDDGKQTIQLNLQQVSRSESHLVMLLRERLEHLQLTGPVIHIHLKTPCFLPFTVNQPGLLQEPDQPSTDVIGPVLERLQARLGTESVKGVKGRQDHRPEYSWCLRELHEPADCTALPRRPGWLFPQPQHCCIDHYQILTGPERIESGWWDGHDCRRDYFVVRDQNGSTLWAFHEYKPHPGWYLHGLFS